MVLPEFPAASDPTGLLKWCSWHVGVLFGTTQLVYYRGIPLSFMARYTQWPVPFMPQDPMDFEWSYWIEWGRERILWLLAGHLLVSQVSRFLVEKVCRGFLHSREFLMGLFTVEMGSFAVRPLRAVNLILWCELCVEVSCLNVWRLQPSTSKSLCLVVSH